MPKQREKIELRYYMGVSPSVFKSMKGTATPLSMFNISAEKGWEGFQFLPIE